MKIHLADKSRKLYRKFLGALRPSKKIGKFLNIVRRLIEYEVRANLLLSSAMNCIDPITQPIKEGDVELIVSFTTYNKRIHDVHLVVESIAKQTIKPNRLLLWLDEEEFDMESIPQILHRQIKRGLEVRFCRNYGSYKKLIPTLKSFPEANIITIDDDFLYSHDIVEMLIKEHARYPDYILGHRAHKIKLGPMDEILPYDKWELGTVDSKASDLIFLTGCGAILYPRNCFNEEVLNLQAFLSLCPNADDVWFKAMALLNNVKCKKVNDSRSFFQKNLLMNHSQDIGLWHSNMSSLNNIQLKAVFEKYDLKPGNE